MHVHTHTSRLLKAKSQWHLEHWMLKYMIWASISMKLHNIVHFLLPLHKQYPLNGKSGWESPVTVIGHSQHVQHRSWGDQYIPRMMHHTCNPAMVHSFLIHGQSGTLPERMGLRKVTEDWPNSQQVVNVKGQDHLIASHTVAKMQL